MATHIVDPDGGGDYTSLRAWEAAQITGTPSETINADCRSGSGSADSEANEIFIDGFTSQSAANYVRIFCNSSYRHDGKWNTAKYRLSLTGIDNWQGIEIDEPYVRFEAIQFERTKVQASDMVMIDLNCGTVTSDIRIEKCIIRCTGAQTTGGTPAAIRWYSDATAKIVNNIIYDVTCGIDAWWGGNVTNGVVYNNTIYNCGGDFGVGLAGDAADNNIYLKNNVVDECASVCYNLSDIEASATNASGDTSSPETGLRNVTPSYVDEGADDFHLQSGDAELQDMGTDLSADAQYSFSDDIDYETRSGSWDIGADEYVTAGAADLNINVADCTAAEGVFI